MTIQIFIANNVKSLNDINPTHTVEAEFGQYCVEGSETTLAHHGPRSENAVPCLGDNIPSATEEFVIGVSHFDLDALGGVMRCLGLKDFDGEEDLFWQVAAQVDLRGIHKLGEIQDEFLSQSQRGGSLSPSGSENVWYHAKSQWDVAEAKLNAFWAWSEANRLFAPRLVKSEDREFTPGLMDGSDLADPNLVDVTTFFTEAIRIISLILEGSKLDPERVVFLQKGQDWVEAKEALEEESFQGTFGQDFVVLRASEQFTNHLYSHGNTVAKAVVAFRTDNRTVTLSLADPIDGVNCCNIAQALWGSEADGHAGIAGSPRGQVMTMEDADMAAHKLSLAIRDLE